MSAAVAEETLLSELWLSFASLLRSYAAAAGLSGGPAAEAAIAGESVTITCGAARLQIVCDPVTGAGNWQLRSGAQVVTEGRFDLLPEGRIALDGSTLDLDHAAIDLVQQLSKSGFVSGCDSGCAEG